ncbi:hypothetical protein [Pseudogracilibacillus sp. SO30301A]|uniref:hypothetical protein n=1 Tax=Pseudogracilibacillus sp. SO30301A TaxID=3098291 RepID=UPI00300E2F20
MKIVYIVPVPMDEKEDKRRECLLNNWAFPNTTVEVQILHDGPTTMESMYEKYLSIPGTAKLMVEVEKKGADGAIIGCAGDPGLDAFRD